METWIVDCRRKNVIKFSLMNEGKKRHALDSRTRPAEFRHVSTDNIRTLNFRLPSGVHSTEPSRYAID